MNKLTANEIISIIEEQGISVENFAHNDFGPSDDWVCPDDRLQAQRIAYKAYYDLPYEERKGQSSPDYDYNTIDKLWAEQIGLGEWEEIEQFGGEGDGSTWYSVKYFKDHDVYIRTDGYYQSYHGTDFHDGYGKGVKPQQKTITVYN